MRILRIYTPLQLSFIMYSRVNYLYHVVHDIRSACLSWNWKSVPFGDLPLIPSHPASYLW